MSDLQKIESAVSKIDSAIERGMAANQLAGQMSRALALAGAIQDIRELLTPEVMAPIMALQGTAIGFKTDKDNSGGYPEKIIKDCILEAVLNGVYPCGNEFNVIAGRAYITKEGMGRKLKSIQGLSYSITPGIPQGKGENGAIIEMSIDYTYNGEKKSVKLPVCVRVNSGMGADAIIGKATRKARAWLFQAVTGQEVPEGDIEDVSPMRNVTPKQSPFEKPTEKPQTKVDTLEMTKAELCAKVEELATENSVVDEMTRWLDGKSLEDVPEAQLKQIVKSPDKWIQALKK